MTIGREIDYSYWGWSDAIGWYPFTTGYCSPYRTLENNEMTALESQPIPPIVEDLIAKLHDRNLTGWSRDMYALTLEKIDKAIQEALVKYRRK